MLLKRFKCFFRGHDYRSIIRANDIVDHKGMYIGLATLLRCNNCGKNKSVVTWSEE